MCLLYVCEYTYSCMGVERLGFELGVFYDDDGDDINFNFLCKFHT